MGRALVVLGFALLCHAAYSYRHCNYDLQYNSLLLVHDKKYFLKISVFVFRY